MPQQLPQLTRVPLHYRASQMERWKKGSYSLLRRSEASPFIKEMITWKIEGRARDDRSSDRRFFGEAFVDATLPHKEGWFGSYKWLTCAKWLLERRAADTPFQARLRAALHTHIGAPALERTQKQA